MRKFPLRGTFFLVHSVRVANATQREPYPRKLCYAKVTATTTAVTSEAEHFVVVADLAGIYVAGQRERERKRECVRESEGEGVTTVSGKLMKVLWFV